MSKFKVGDLVRVVRVSYAHAGVNYQHYIWSVGVVERVLAGNLTEGPLYRIDFNRPHPAPFFEHELEAV